MDDDKRNSNFDDYNFSQELGQQIQEQMDEVSASRANGQPAGRTAQGKKKKHRGFKICFIVVALILAIGGVFVGTHMGRSAIYGFASNYIYNNMEHNDEIVSAMEEHNSGDIVGRKDEGVSNYLLFGIEEIKGARNTDSMMIASINSVDGSVKLTSLMRDSYVEIPGHKANKLNSAYAKGGADLLIQTIENNFKIHIDGYAWVNFESFEKVVDSLGGINIELGAKEAKYLNWANYISNPKYRDVKEGMNELNGNQVLGYCRVRKVETLGGANYDYGRTLRHRRTMEAMLTKFKSLGLTKQLSSAKECMGYVTSSLTEEQIKQIIDTVIENKITSFETLRLPVDGAYQDPKKYNGIGYPLIYDWDKNIAELYKFIYGEDAPHAASETAK